MPEDEKRRDDVLEMLHKQKETCQKKYDDALEKQKEELRQAANDRTSIQGHHAGEVQSTVHEGCTCTNYLVEMYQRELGQINIAIKRAEQGTYGICAQCDGNIDLARLQLALDKPDIGINTSLCCSCAAPKDTQFVNSYKSEHTHRTKTKVIRA